MANPHDRFQLLDDVDLRPIFEQPTGRSKIGGLETSVNRDK